MTAQHTVAVIGAGDMGHGFATLLLARSWSNRGRAAAYLGCSVSVLDTYYGWIDKRQKLEEVQDLLVEVLACQ